MAPYSNSNNPGSYTRSDYRQPLSSHYQTQRPAPKPVLARRKGSPNHPGPKQSLAFQAQATTRRRVQSPSLFQPLSLKDKKSGGYALAGSSMMLALMAVLLPHSAKSPASQTSVCQQQVQPQSVLSRDELTKLLAVPERSVKEAVRQVIAEPFCTLTSVEVREGVTAEREAYPLEFDPQTWLVILYEGNEYAGYDFSFQR